MKIECTRLDLCVDGVLQGFGDLRINQLGLEIEIKGFSLWEEVGNRWVRFPKDSTDYVNIYGWNFLPKALDAIDDFRYRFKRENKVKENLGEFENVDTTTIECTKFEERNENLEKGIADFKIKQLGLEIEVWGFTLFNEFGMTWLRAPDNKHINIFSQSFVPNALKAIDRKRENKKIKGEQQ